SVLEITQPIAQGQVISANDLDIAKISLSANVSVVPASEAGSVIGRRVSIPLVAGALLAPKDLTTNGSPPPGNAIVGVAVKTGQLPAAGVDPGEAVDIVMTGSPGSPDTATGTGGTPGQALSTPNGPGTILALDVLVTDVAYASAASGSDTVVVSLLVPRALAPAVASASAAGQAALVLVHS
ncbi:MAG: SAF domain-containing protein, partial [Nitrososphaerales archaeon]